SCRLHTSTMVWIQWPLYRPNECCQSKTVILHTCRDGSGVEWGGDACVALVLPAARLPRLVVKIRRTLICQNIHLSSSEQYALRLADFLATLPVSPRPNSALSS